MIAFRPVLSVVLLAVSLSLAGCRGQGDEGTTTVATSSATATVAAATAPPEPTTPPAPTSATLTLAVPADIAVGSQFTATVQIDGVTDLGAYQFRPAFDEAGLRLISVQDDGFLGSSGRLPTCQTAASESGAGTFYCVTIGGQPPGPSGSGTLATITLQALAPGTFELSLADVQVTTPNGTEAPVTVVDTSVTVP